MTALPSSILAALLLSDPAAAAAAVNVCHRTGAAGAIPISIAPSALAAHLRHGDTLTRVWFRDGDGDGFGDPAGRVEACAQPEGHVANDGDCDDRRADVGPGAPEICDGADNDCDGEADGGLAGGSSVWYLDGDGDGFGDPAQPLRACSAPPGAVDNPLDCDDGLAAVNPGAAESCSPYDDDCDGVVNEPEAADASTWYADYDGDGFGDPALAESSCSQPADAVGVAGDCDDRDDRVYPGAVETCNGRDDDCDGSTDEEAVDRQVFAPDGDGDGYGDPALGVLRCEAGPGMVALDLPDCDDADAAVSPGAEERCNGRDDDCDGSTDEPDATDAPTGYADADGDGFGDALLAARACALPAGHVANDLDCDDTRAAVRPGAEEVCNAVDDDCDGTVDGLASCSRYEAVAVDSPVDWFGAARDCEARGMHLVSIGDEGEVAILESFDAGPALYWIGGSTPVWEADLAQIPTYGGEDWTWTTAEPWSFQAWAPGQPSGLPGERCAAIELGGAGWVDRDCGEGLESWICEDDGLLPTDADGDGVSWGGGDCDDRSPAFGPSAAEVCDGFDDDCDGEVDEDFPNVGDHWYWDGDGDGFGVYDLAVHDCNGAPPDGFSPAYGDCDDALAEVSPAAVEVCNGQDDDCDGQVDEGCP